MRISTHPEQHPDKTAHTSLYAKIITDSNTALKRCDAGEYVHFPAGSGLLESSEWGETMIPGEYARRHYSDKTDFIGFFEGYSKHYLQPAIVLRKRE